MNPVITGVYKCSIPMRTDLPRKKHLYMMTVRTAHSIRQYGFAGPTRSDRSANRIVGSIHLLHHPAPPPILIEDNLMNVMVSFPTRTEYSQTRHPFAFLLGFMDDSVTYKRNVDSLDRGDARSRNNSDVVATISLPHSLLFKSRALYSCESYKYPQSISCSNSDLQIPPPPITRTKCLSTGIKLETLWTKVPHGGKQRGQMGQ